MRPYFLTFAAAASLLAGSAHAAAVSGIETQHFDPSVRIQDDLFLAVNGNWIKNTPIPPDKSNYGSFIILRDLSESRSRAIIEEAAGKPQTTGSEAQKIGLVYQSFMDEKTVEQRGIAPLLPELKTIEKLKTPKDLARYFGKLQQDAVDGPLRIYVDQDSKDSTQYLTNVTQGGIGLPDRDYYLQDDARFKQAREAYLGYLTTLFTLAGEKDAAALAQSVLTLETAIAKDQWTKVDNRDPVKTYNKMTRAQLAALTKSFNWNLYLEGADLNKVKSLNLAQPSYAQGLTKLIESQPVSTWQTYFKARRLDDAAPILSKAFVDAHFDFHGKTLQGSKELRPRWKRAVQAVEGSLGEAIGKLYVAKHFPPESKRKMDELVGNLMKAFGTSIDGLTWMTPATKVQAKRKLSTYMTKIGYPNKWRDYSALQATGDDLYGNMKRVASFDYHWMTGKLGKPVDRDEWGMTPQTVNAYYNPSLNEIVFPAAILQPPFFNAEADDAVNYGGIGAVIGHEISHGFDDQGSQFDANGNLKNWWTAEDKAAFKVLTEKLVAQYAAYEPLPGKKINGELTLGENIADLSGMQIAYKAYRLSLAGKEAPVIDGLTGDQRFFMGFSQIWRSNIRDEALLQRLVTDPHSPGHYRPIGSAVNSDAFQKTFDVKPGDKMYKPENERIRIW